MTADKRLGEVPGQAVEREIGAAGLQTNGVGFDEEVACSGNVLGEPHRIERPIAGELEHHGAGRQQGEHSGEGDFLLCSCTPAMRRKNGTQPQA